MGTNETTGGSGKAGPSEFRVSYTGHALIIMSIGFAGGMTIVLVQYGIWRFDKLDIGLRYFQY
mgnify:FL=1